jgi:hypothetical protein
MDFNDRNRRNRGYVTFRMIFDLCMGTFYILGGLFVIFSTRFQVKFDLAAPVYIGLGGILLVYGGYRIYRGIRHIF